MKLRSIWVLVVVICITMSVLGWGVWAQSQGVSSTQWEYTVRIAVAPSEKTSLVYVELGADGWELVSVSEGCAYFKRPKR